MGFLCDDPICAEIEIDVRDVAVSNTEYHGDIWCHMFVTDGMVLDGAKQKVETDIAGLRRKKHCERSCACTSIEVASFTVKHSQHIHRHHVYDSGFLHGNCRVSFDLEFKLDFRVYVGICHDPDFSKASEEVQAMLAKLRKFGERIEEITDPDEIWKRIGGVSPKGLRESPSVEPPRRIRRRPAGGSGAGPAPTPPSPTPDGRSGLHESLRGQRLEHALDRLRSEGIESRLAFQTIDDPSRQGLVVDARSIGELIELLVGTRVPALTDIEDIGETFAARLGEAGMNAAKFSEIDVGTLKIERVGQERLARWQAMLRWMQLAPFLDGNGAELLVRGLGLDSREQTKQWLAGKSPEQVRAAITEASERVKLPSEYLAAGATLIEAALNHALR